MDILNQQMKVILQLKIPTMILIIHKIYKQDTKYTQNKQHAQRIYKTYKIYTKYTSNTQSIQHIHNI